MMCFKYTSATIESYSVQGVLTKLPFSKHNPPRESPWAEFSHGGLSGRRAVSVDHSAL